MLQEGFGDAIRNDGFYTFHPGGKIGRLADVYNSNPSSTDKLGQAPPEECLE